MIIINDFFPIFWQEKKTKNFINFIKIFLRWVIIEIFLFSKKF